MKSSTSLLPCFFLLLSISCLVKPTPKATLVRVIGEKEYTRLMTLSLDDFDQSPKGFRRYSDDYQLQCLLIPEYIKVNELNGFEAGNMHWHLGQMNAFNDNIEEAIVEMELSYIQGMPIFWKCYVDGSVAFLQKDKPKLEAALALLKQQENQMNIEFLVKFVKYFDQSYLEAYNADL